MGINQVKTCKRNETNCGHLENVNYLSCMLQKSPKFNWLLLHSLFYKSCKRFELFYYDLYTSKVSRGTEIIRCQLIWMLPTLFTTHKQLETRDLIRLFA